MNLTDLASRASRLVARNSPAILTGVGIAGVVTTAFLTGKATFLYMKDLSEEGYFDRDYKFDRTPKEHFQKAWKLYIPPVVVGFATITAIIFSNRIDSRRMTALAAAYTLSEKGWEEYKEKIVEMVGERKEQAARDEIAQAQVTANPPSNQIIITGNGDVLCLDRWSGRYFWSTMEKIKMAQVNVIYKIQNRDYCSLSEFYDELGLAHTTESDNIGWNNDTKLEIGFSHALDPDNRPCLTFEFRAIPFQY